MPDWNCVGGFSKRASATFTRPANTTPYTAQGEVGTSGTAATSFAVARESDTSGVIIGAKLTYSSNPAADPQFRLLLFSANITAAGDNAALALSDADAALMLGWIDFDTTQACGSTTSHAFNAVGAPVNAITFDPASGLNTVYGILICRQGFTPIANSETITVELMVEQN